MTSHHPCDALSPDIARRRAQGFVVRINMQSPLALYVLMRWCDRHAVSL
jgi:hypothetical protein